jgi:hypothetical protein
MMAGDPTAGAASTHTLIRLKAQIFALSFAALFLELMVIRWVPSIIALIAYYANLMLLSSFLGLGAGALSRKAKWSLFEWFPLFVAGALCSFLLCRGVMVGMASSEVRFHVGEMALLNAVVLVWIFAANALMFVPLGQKLGKLFDSMPPLSAYGWDLAGGLCGTLAFGWFSVSFFSPVVGIAIIAMIHFATAQRRQLVSLAVFLALISLLGRSGLQGEIWSPYHHVTVSRIETPSVIERAPPSELRTMRNPPIYRVKVNQFSYHYNGSFDVSRYDPQHRDAEFVAAMANQYRLPYELGIPHERVLVVGAGGGADVAMGLRMGAREIDAVEIDPAIVELSRRFNADGPYLDRRVKVHVDDARAFFTRAQPGYDLVAFGFLDSQALFSSMGNVRLDGYVYTVESLRSAFRLVADHGALVLSFYVPVDWLGPKLSGMLSAATGRKPTIFTHDRQTIFVVPKGPSELLPSAVGAFSRAAFPYASALDLSTDDWPYLYLKHRSIPADYLLAIASLLGFSLLTLMGMRGRSMERSDVHFGLLGMGFLLVETKGITDCTLFFGATWFVTMTVIVGVLLMVIAANTMATRLRQFSFWLYAPLFVGLALLAVVPREYVLGLPFVGRLMWTLIMVPMPVFFAGLIFSTTFRDADSPARAFGSNLIGAMIGGFCEYLAMVTGNHRLILIVAAAYAGSLLVMLAARRSTRLAVHIGGP